MVDGAHLFILMLELKCVRGRQFGQLSLWRGAKAFARVLHPSWLRPDHPEPRRFQWRLLGLSYAAIGTA